jgi:hypothetical protein
MEISRRSMLVGADYEPIAAGELLAEMATKGERHDGAGRKERSQPVTVKLDDLGVTKMQSSRWQKLAKLPEEKFEEKLQRAKSAAENSTTSARM